MNIKNSVVLHDHSICLINLELGKDISHLSHWLDYLYDFNYF